MSARTFLFFLIRASSSFTFSLYSSIVISPALNIGRNGLFFNCASSSFKSLVRLSDLFSTVSPWPFSFSHSILLFLSFSVLVLDTNLSRFLRSFIADFCLPTVVKYSLNHSTISFSVLRFVFCSKFLPSTFSKKPANLSKP